ncbi:hypothetical protein Pmani_001185 [Petrolisthes manimaculis]|uniref:Uncharacterized protein n=1 Tax=Petrolisthes manimaculis TaxID=1843537 RepID=A0AAE1QNM6_9EUCA|nr:hypothetical protein Pmani_001185 [Petrolisthes manimaculis]
MIWCVLNPSTSPTVPCRSDDRRAREKYQVNPDLRFRLMGEKPSDLVHLDVSWYVTTREDVGGFRVTVFNSTSGKEVTRSNVTYDARTKDDTEPGECVVM